MINLTEQERDRFTAYLLQESDAIETALERLPEFPAGEQLLRNLKAEILACRILVARLEQGDHAAEIVSLKHGL